MSRCLHLAQQGLGNVAPNPMVGCVIVLEDKIIGEGFHQNYGGPHAEVHAIRSVQDRLLLKDSILYVNLEPCSHFGKTPPCTELIIKNKIPHVVIGCADPYSEVNGQGIERLRNAGVKVTAFVMESECQFLNRRFLTYHQKQRPYIILKWAQSADGFIDRDRNPGDHGVNWISGAESKALVHMWRSQESSILVGRKTVENDNPSLTVREVEGRNPIRIVFDPDLLLSTTSQVFNDKAKTIILNTIRDEKVDGHLQYIRAQKGDASLISNLKRLHDEGIQSVLVEGGAETINRFIKTGLWDETRIITGELLFGSGLQAPSIQGRLIDEYPLGTDTISIYAPF